MTDRYGLDLLWWGPIREKSFDVERTDWLCRGLRVC
jgi:hypothetical protein